MSIKTSKVFFKKENIWNVWLIIWCVKANTSYIEANILRLSPNSLDGRTNKLYYMKERNARIFTHYLTFLCYRKSGCSWVMGLEVEPHRFWPAQLWGWLLWGCRRTGGSAGWGAGSEHPSPGSSHWPLCLQEYNSERINTISNWPHESEGLRSLTLFTID